MTSFTTTYTMKATDLPWLATIPEHWQLCRAKLIFFPVDIRSVDGLEEILTVSSTLGIVPRKFANVTMFEAISYEGYKLCWPGDLVINSLWAWAFALGVSQYHGVVSTAYGVYRLLPRVQVDLRFIHLLLRSVPFQWELQTRSKGIWISRLQLTDESFLDAPLPLPTLEEQMCIAKYLDHADQMLRGGVSSKQRLGELMEEYKRAVIQQTVTRGLDPDVPLKPSGVEWLGDIPEHWEVRRMKQAAQLNPSKNEIVDILSKDIYVSFLPMEMVGTNGDFAENMAHISEVRNGFTYFRRGDVIVAKITPCFENGKGACLESLSTEFGFGSTEFHVLRSKSSVLPRFLYYTTGLTEFRNQGSESMTGAAGQQRVPQSFVANYPILLPPIPEQAAIVAHLDKLTSDIDAAIAHTRREIELLEEYRTRLIADVVTGKLDVREAVANLPDVDLDDLQPLAEGYEADD